MPDLASLPVEAAELQPRRGWPIATHTPHTLQPCHVPQADSKLRSIRTIPQTTALKQGEISQADRRMRELAERAARQVLERHQPSALLICDREAGACDSRHGVASG